MSDASNPNIESRSTPQYGNSHESECLVTLTNAVQHYINGKTSGEVMTEKLCPSTLVRQPGLLSTFASNNTSQTPQSLKS